MDKVVNFHQTSNLKLSLRFTVTVTWIHSLTQFISLSSSWPVFSVSYVKHDSLALRAADTSAWKTRCYVTFLSVVRVYTLAGHKLADQGGFPDTPCTQYRDCVRADLFRRHGTFFLAILFRRCQRVRPWSSSSKRVTPVNDSCNMKKKKRCYWKES